MIDLKAMSMEELNNLDTLIQEERQTRQENRKKETWQKVLEAVEEYNQATGNYGIEGTDADGEEYSIQFTTDCGWCDLYHYA